MQQIVLIIHVLVAISIIALVLLQHGKGADIGATFGSGASQTVFGSRGSISFLMKVTSILAFIFFVTSIGLSYMASHDTAKSNDLINLPASSSNSSSNNTNSVPIINIEKNIPNQSKT